MRTITRAGITLAIVALPGVAAAQDETELMTGIGVAISVGGGVEDFTGEDMRDTSDPGGLWDIRAVVGTRSYLGFEAGYVGTAAAVDAPLGGETATLLGTTVEALARTNFLPDSAIQPYAFLGAAWRRYDVQGEDFTTSDSGMADTDDLFQIPVGAGLGYRYSNIIADARFTFRLATGEDLVVQDEADDEFAAMHTWGVSGRVGYEF